MAVAAKRNAEVLLNLALLFRRAARSPFTTSVGDVRSEERRVDPIP